MSTLFKILEKLSNQKTWYCFQSQSNNYYNLSVVNPKGVKETFHSDDIKKIEKRLDKLWGHLLEEDKPKIPKGFPLL